MATKRADEIRGTADTERLLARAATAFRPSAPITQKGVFAGREKETRAVIDGVLQPGQHVVIYGDPGVGKTSLANILKPTLASLGSTHLIVKVNCDSADDFDALWRKAAEELASDDRSPSVYVNQADVEAAIERFRNEPVIRPNVVRRFLERLPETVFIFDEFNTLTIDPSAVFANLIKTLSDYVVPSTMVIVGVASNVEELIIGHGSIERAILQIAMPRMEPPELSEIIALASASIGITFSDDVVKQIVRISQGLPNYVHLLGLFSARSAILPGRLKVEKKDLEVAYRDATESASHTLRSEYDMATGSARKDALFKAVLLACALTEKDGVWFRAGQVRKPLHEIAGRFIDIPQFSQHLADFCSVEHGAVLEVQGQKKNRRYRFRNPLLEPYVIIRGLASGLIPSV